MDLAKLGEINVYGSLGAIDFQFNPVLEETETPRYAKVRILNKGVAKLDYTGSDGTRFSLKLLFDANHYDSGGQGGKTKLLLILQLLRKYREKDSITNAPPVIIFTYGSDIKTWVVISKMRISHILRDSNLLPMRFEVELSLNDVKDQYSRTTREEKGKQYITITSVATMRSLSGKYLNDYDAWNIIAKYNRDVLVDTKGITLEPGTEIYIPAWSDIESQMPVPDTGLVEFT